MKNTKILLKGLSKFVDERNIRKVRLIFDEFHPSDIYKEIEEWQTEKSVLLLRLLREKDASELFSKLSPEQQENVIETLTSEEISEIFEEMYTDEAIDILEELPLKITSRILKAADSDTRSKINSILRYQKHQIGYHMVVEYISIPSGITIKKAKELISNQVNNDDLEIVGNIFVFDSRTKEYVGYIKPDSIIANKNIDIIDEWVEKTIPAKVTDHIAEAQEDISQYDLSAVPVVNEKNKLIGVIEAEDIIEKYEEAEEAAYEQAAIKVINKPYLDISIIEMFKSRVPWIISLLIIGTLTQIIILGFQNIWISNSWMADPSNISGLSGSGIAILAVVTALSLSSSINDSAGNAGSQTSSTLVRSIALGEINKGSYGKAIRKEFFVACIIGLVVMVTAFFRIIVIWGIFGEFGGYGKGTATLEWVSYMMLIAMIASVSFFITIVLGNLVGAVLPIIAKKYNIDGAIFSGPVQTTVVDIMTISIYFSITTITFILIDIPSDIEHFPKSISYILNTFMLV
ncbi:MAG: magnesium transporter [Mycoplasmataceae bacterium]|nr:magnesium transporter [Mycoplasmataceae bacterium]